MVAEIKFAKTHPDAVIPIKGDSGNMCFDFFACFDEDFIEIKPFEVKLIPTGIATAFNEQWGLVLKERSSTGKINMKVNAGVVDSNYRGQIFAAILNNNKDRSIFISKIGEHGEQSPLTEDPNAILYPYDKAICQGMIVPSPDVVFEEISYFDLLSIPSTRGIGCLGSSGR